MNVFVGDMDPFQSVFFKPVVILPRDIVGRLQLELTAYHHFAV